MRRLLLIPTSIVLTAVGGLLICATMHKNPHTMELSVAAATALLASIAGLAPLFFARHATQLGLSQAALAGTMAHLFVSIAMAAVVILGKLPLHGAFLIWLSAFYWMSLIALAITSVKLIKSATPAQPNKA